MADIALIEVINQVAIVNANSTLNELSANINWIEPKMRFFQSLIKQLECKQDQTFQEAILITCIRDVALDISYSLDTYLSETEAQNRNRRSGFVKHAACIPCYGTTANDTTANYNTSQRRELERLAHDNKDSIRLMDFRGNEDVETRDPKSFVMEDSPFVGRKESLEKLKAELLSINSECKMISVVGVEGIGKTSLVKKVCRELQEEFELSTLVCVSDKPSLRDVLLEIARKAGLSEDKMDENLEINLRSLFAEKKFLIYLDDIRSKKTWNVLQIVLPIRSRNRSRIIITCRNADVGRYISWDTDANVEWCLVKLNPLDQDDSWELFWTLIKSSSERHRRVGRDIVERCHGFPLTIVSVAGMLNKKGRGDGVWEEVLEYLHKIDETYISNIRNLGYRDLPVEVKHFFLYFGLYPVNSKISVSELTRALLADKLIKLEEHGDPEEFVEEKLEELSGFNLIEVSRRRLSGRIRSCHMNHFQHGICIQALQVSKLFATLSNSNIHDFSRIRRLTIDDYNLSRHLHSMFRDARLRTLFFFVKDGEMKMIPDEIGDLRLLTFLKLTGHYQQMPSSVSKLNKLETLDVGKASFQYAFPATIWKMESIKHLLLSRDLLSKHRHVTSEVNLPNVETLGWITCELFQASSLHMLSNLKNLKLLDATAGQIVELSKLEKLEQLWLNADPRQRTKLNLSAYHNLFKLHLSYDCSYDITLDHVEFPPNLIELILKHIKFKADPMSVLKKLPKLKYLKLKHCFCLLILDCSGPNSFPELQELEITNSFSKLIAGDWGMQNLRKFAYGGCGEPTIPDRLREIIIRPTDETDKNTGDPDKRKEPMPWFDENERAFIEILCDSVKSRKLQSPNIFTKDEWDKINKDMLAITKLDYGTDRLKGKWNHLCLVYSLFTQLLGHSGVAWDPNANHVNATEEVWQQFYTINKTEYETFRKKGCKHYELLREILGKTTSTRGLENVSTRQHDDGISKEHQNEESKIRKTELEASIARWLEKSFNQLAGNGEGTSQDPYSNIVCLNILNKMEGVSNSVYMKAINAFENPNFRMSFVMMPEIRRGPVLELL